MKPFLLDVWMFGGVAFVVLDAIRNPTLPAMLVASAFVGVVFAVLEKDKP